jgi:hypothetical protein
MFNSEYDDANVPITEANLSSFSLRETSRISKKHPKMRRRTLTQKARAVKEAGVKRMHKPEKRA